MLHENIISTSVKDDMCYFLFKTKSLVCLKIMFYPLRGVRTYFLMTNRTYLFPNIWVKTQGPIIHRIISVQINFEADKIISGIISQSHINLPSQSIDLNNLRTSLFQAPRVRSLRRPALPTLTPSGTTQGLQTPPSSHT